MNTKTLDFLNIRVGQFPDRSMRRLLAEAENVRGLMEIVADHLIVA